MKYDFLVYIGRFQPLHKGHIDVIEQALQKAERLIIVVGSHAKASDFRNPFSSSERLKIFNLSLPKNMLDRIDFVFQPDHTYNEEKWLASVQSQVLSATMRTWRADSIRIGIVGFNKDHSSFYLRKFPMWDLVEINPKFPDLNATDVRNLIFSEFSQSKIANEFEKTYSYSGPHESIVLGVASTYYQQKREEAEFLNSYRTKYGSGPFLTADALVTQAGHILLVKRGSEYGQGLWALPGGFVNPNETFRNAVLRELFEETQIDVPKPVLNGSIIKEKMFDDPSRSSRGRIVTMCSHFKLNDNYDLPKVKGSDDADRAFWVPISEFIGSRHRLFEDHFCIIENMLGI